MAEIRFFAQLATGGRWTGQFLPALSGIDQTSAVRAFLARRPLAFPIGLAGLGGTIGAPPLHDAAKRLSDAAKGVIEAQDGAAYEEAYHFIQQTRMQQHQLQARDELPYSNRVDPDHLNHLDRRILRESFRQAQRLQGSLAMRYQL